MKDKLRIVWKCNRCLSSKHIEEEDDSLALSNKVRTCYLNHLKKVLLSNYQSCLRETTDPYFSMNDVQHCAADMELQAIHKCVVVVLYQRAMAKMITDIKKDTRRQKIHRKLKDFVPCSNDIATQTDPVWNVKTAAVQTSVSSRDNCWTRASEVDDHCKQQEMTCQDAMQVKQECFSPPFVQQTPLLSPPTLDEIPLPGTDPPQLGTTLQTCVQNQPDTTQCQASVCGNAPIKTQSFEMRTESSSVRSLVDTLTQQQTSSSGLPSSLGTNQQQLEPFSNQHYTNIQPFVVTSQHQSHLQHASQQQVSSASGQLQVQRGSQRQVSSVSVHPQMQCANQQQVQSLSAQSEAQCANQQQASSLSGQSQVQSVTQQTVSSLSGQSQVQCARQQKVSSVSGESQMEHASHQQVSSISVQPQVQCASQQQVQSLSAQSQVQCASQQQGQSLSAQSQVQCASQRQVQSLSAQSQVQCSSEQQVSSLNEQSQMKDASQQQVSSLSEQLQVKHANQQQVSSWNVQCKVQHAKQPQVLSLSEHSKVKNASKQHVSPLNEECQVQHAIQQKLDSLNSQLQLQHASRQKLVALCSQLQQEQHAIQPKVESLRSEPQLLQEDERKVVSVNHHQASVQHVHIGNQPQLKKMIQQPIKVSAKGQLHSASEKELQSLALQHLQSAYEKWLQTASRQQRLIITQQQAQSSGQVLQSASQQRLQAVCLRQLRTAYQAWSRECDTDSLHKLQAAYVQWLDAATSRQPQSLGDADMPTSSAAPDDDRPQLWPPFSLSRPSRPRQPVQPCVRQTKSTVPVESHQIQVIDHQEPTTVSWQFPSSDPGECSEVCDTVLPDITRSSAEMVLQKTNLVRRYSQQGSKGVVQVEASPIPVVLSRNSGLIHKIHYHQAPRNPNNIEIIPISEETLVKIEAEEETGSEMPVSPCRAQSNNNAPVSLYCTESNSTVMPQNKENEQDDKVSKGMKENNISRNKSVPIQKNVESDDDDAGECGPSPAFSSTNSEIRSNTSRESSVSGGETAVCGETGNIGNEGSEEETVQRDNNCIEVEEDFQTKLLLRELLSGGNTPTDELIEGTEIPYVAIVSGLEELSSQNTRKRKSQTDLLLPEKRVGTSATDIGQESPRRKVGGDILDSPGHGFWVQERLAQEKVLVRKWRQLDCNVLKKARRKQRCVRLFGSDDDLVLTDRELNICKGRIIPWIVRELKPYYREGRVISRPVFKSVARHTANRLVSWNCYPGVCDVRKTVREFFRLHKVVASVDDVF